MLALLVVLSLAQTPVCDAMDDNCPSEIETLESEDLDQAIIFLIKKEVIRRKAKTKLPVCPFEPGTYWNLECA